jgi:hypothetical protein
MKPLAIVIIILLAFTALAIACAVAIALRRDAGIGRRARHLLPDPFLYPFGDVPMMNSAGPLATRADADGGGQNIPSWLAPISKSSISKSLVRGRTHG